jgi:hypothetical protein
LRSWAAPQVTEDSFDPLFKDAYVLVNEWRDAPFSHRYVHGGFTGTDARFSFYFPSAERYEGRFHHNTYPLATSADLGPFPIAFDVAIGNLGFTLDSGAYYVQTNNGGRFDREARDLSVAAFRANAAAAKYSRVVASELYGKHRPFGYLYGGSGGCYQTVGGAELTSGVWDGFMPFVMGSNNAVPSVFAVRMQALRILRKRNKFHAVMDAINPGGSGDMYAELNEEERAALKEATLMGFPPRGWYAHETLGSGYFADIAPIIPMLDPTYVEDFWSKPGYLGGDATSSIRAERFQFDTTVARVTDGPPVQVELASVPHRPFIDAHLILLSGPAAGRGGALTRIEGRTVGFSTSTDPSVVAAIRAGDPVRIDNSWPLALETIQRHQMPRSAEEYAWNQFRDGAGKPLYPQRDVRIGEYFTAAAAGSLLSGRFQGKMLLVQSLMDIDALPWGADWYRSLVKRAMGPGFEDSFALWFIDHAQHDNPQTPIARAHAVRYSGALQQGLRDLALWVEKGVRPSETSYRMVGSQVEVPARANERRGPQAVVDLKANGGERADVAVGERTHFTATIEMPPGAGKVVAADWDFEGLGTYRISESLGTAQVSLSATHTYSKPGTYYAVLRAASHRLCDKQSPYARIENIGRARVVVR